MTWFRKAPPRWLRMSRMMVLMDLFKPRPDCVHGTRDHIHVTCYNTGVWALCTCLQFSVPISSGHCGPIPLSLCDFNPLQFWYPSLFERLVSSLVHFCWHTLLFHLLFFHLRDIEMVCPSHTIINIPSGVEKLV